MMNTTAANILKILSQTEMSIEDMQLYLNVEKNSISKSIFQLNEFLESIKLPIILKKGNFYSLKLNSKELKILFENFTTLTTEEKTDYLFIKFIANGFLNLEKEKDILNISRSTILRCFQVVKDNFSKTGTTYEYNHGKGLVLKKVSPEDKSNFYKKLMKLFIEEDILVPIRRDLLSSLKNFHTKERLTQLYPILKNSDIPVNYFLLSFICSLEVCIDIFGGFDFVDESHLEMDQFQIIRKSVDIFGSDFHEAYKNQLSHFLTALHLGNGILDETITKKVLKLIELIKQKFHIKIINKDLEKMLFNKIYLSFFKYNNNILKVLNVSFNKSHEILLENLEDILKELSYHLYLVDKYVIIYVIRRIIIDENFSNAKKVLLLFNEVAAADKVVFKKSLKKFYPNITFHIEATFFHKKNVVQKFENYDIIISDSNIISNAEIVEFYDVVSIHGILEKRSLENGIKKLIAI
ncbi:BglG family transcription antiterminator [Candidatus Cetobacterium colombiensis]|uniref:Mga helix-turn-helix domain-containing protein n=1 Tax=Candidatus Cetobacterium colombiensis TaxID=3073100 RepID=A0ABU4W9T4_9FUSO|nr:hypothetical protein [Candidatus Cetobacterium colombiensis]MDX8335974.1 hypothetical protein [Candidatus Cetobacterium colombiensis]